MVCKLCNFENKDGAAFCASCGKPMKDTVPAANPVAPEKNTGVVGSNEPAKVDENKTVIISEGMDQSIDEPTEKVVAPQDDCESNTTVLTGDMVPHGFKAPPMGAPMAPNAPKPAMGAPMAPNAPKPAMGAPMAPNAPKPAMGAPMAPNAPKPAMGAPMPNAPKKQNAPVKPVKAGKGSKVYMIVSIILMVLMAGGLVYGYIYFSGKLDDAKTEKEQLVAERDEANTKAGSYESQIAEKDTELTNLQSQVTSLESEVASYEEQVANFEASSDAYAVYDPLIAFANSSYGQGYADFMCSDTVLHVTDSAQLKLFFYNEGNVMFECADSSVVSCEFGEGWENDCVATLNVTAVGSGNTTITFTNDQNDETIVVYVYVD